MLQTHNCIEPDLNLGTGVRCVMLTKKFLEQNGRSPENYLSKIIDKPVQLMEQVHGTNISMANKYLSEPLLATDGIFTQSKNFGLGVKTADCIPMALSSHDGSEIALLHVGWKGLCDGIIEKFITQHEVKKKQYNAWIGPCISFNNYEVGNEVHTGFCQSTPEAEINFKSLGKEKWKFDLRSEAARRLKLGNVNVSSSKDCTFEDEELYYSYRNNKSRERMVTLIWRSDGK
jgi:hypothetical protein